MKKRKGLGEFILFTVLFVILISLLTYESCKAQTYKINDSGKIVKISEPKQADKLYQIVDGIPFYKSQKGAIYYYRTSKKTGKPYKVYIKPKENGK